MPGTLWPDVKVLREADLEALELAAWALACYGDDGLAALDELDGAELEDEP